jgi:hypothetical protein
MCDVLIYVFDSYVLCVLCSVFSINKTNKNKKLKENGCSRSLSYVAEKLESLKTEKENRNKLLSEYYTASMWLG